MIENTINCKVFCLKIITAYHFVQVQHPTILEINRRILGDDCQLGSVASNTIFPGGSGQEPHIDYPYWDYYDK